MSKVIPTDAQLREKMEEMTQVVGLETMSTDQFVAVLSDKFNGVVDLTSKKKFIETTMGEIIDSMDCDDDDHPAARGEEESISEEELQCGHFVAVSPGSVQAKQRLSRRAQGPPLVHCVSFE